MKKILTQSQSQSLFVMVLLAALSCTAVLGVAGCGNVTLKGEALTAAESSAMDAYQAKLRTDAEPAVPDWLKAYQAENYRQWRFFVRSARKDLAWGPKLPDEGGE